MSVNSVKIKVYSDIGDFSTISASLKNLDIKDIKVEASYPKVMDIKKDEIVILQIKNIESRYLNKILEKKSEWKNKFIFIMKENDAILVSSIAKLGFNDVFVFPYELYKFTSFLQELILNKGFLTKPDENLNRLDSDGFKEIIGSSPDFQRIIELAKRVSENPNISVLILGETGTGKGLLARAIHNHNNIVNTPFVDIVCSAIPENLLESELFGYEKGAFTNALSRKLGLFELAEQGTLFLDEIGDLSLNLQVKLLRVIENKVIRRLGGVNDIPIDTRIISATNKDLQKMIEQNLFRRDLYHRLNVVSLELPPLRERGDDILLLASYFILEFCKQFNLANKKIDDDVAEFFKAYPWPGNVREMRNALERAVLLGEKSTLTLRDFSNILTNINSNSAEFRDNIQLMPNFVRLDVNFEKIDLKTLEKMYSREVLKKMKGNKSRTAKVLGISRPKLDTLLD